MNGQSGNVARSTRPSDGRAAPSFPVREALLVALGVGVGVAVSALVGRSRDAQSVVPVAASVQAAPLVAGSRSPLARPSLPAKPVRQPVQATAQPEPEQEAEPSTEEVDSAHRVQQADQLMDSLVRRLDKLSKALGEGNPDLAVSQSSSYSTGVLEGMLRVAPEVAGELSEHVERRLCDPKAKDAELMLMAQIAGGNTGLASEAGFDCVFRGRSKEDIVLWSALDAWRASGLPATPAMDELARTATDPRTRQRLTTPEQALNEL